VRSDDREGDESQGHGVAETFDLRKDLYKVTHNSIDAPPTHDLKK
jgi:hypothetical protein